MELCINDLRSNFKYNSDTGLLFRKITTSSRGVSGDLAGHLMTTTRYLAVTYKSKQWMVHRLVWALYYGALPKGQIDHINGVRSDNRIENLRDVTHRENMMNTTMSIKNKSGVMGVCWDESRARFVSHMTVNGKTLYLGRYKSLFEACCVRKSAEIKYNFHPNHGKKS